MAFLAYYLCCGCLGHRPKPLYKKSTSVSSPTFNTRFTQENLLGMKIEELGKAGIARGGRPASKAPLTSAKSGVLGGLKYDENDLRKRIFPSRRGSQLVSKRDLDEYFGSSKVKETTHEDRYEDTDGNKVINEYVRHSKIGTGSYGKVVLHRSKLDGQLYAIKIFHKSRLRKLRVAPAETAMMDVLREVVIMKRLEHPNIVKLVEVIDDPESDYFYMVLEYLEGRWIFEGCGPPGGIGEGLARRYFRDVVFGLTYLHKKNIVHGDIKPENLLISSEGRIKIGDFGVSQMFPDHNDQLRRSPGTPVYTAPECCLGVAYGGRAADIWALGCTLYVMVLGRYPFVGASLEATYEKAEQIVNEDIWYPPDMDPELLNLLRSLLCKDPKQRLTLDVIALHPWVIRDDGIRDPAPGA